MIGLTEALKSLIVSSITCIVYGLFFSVYFLPLTLHLIFLNWKFDVSPLKITLQVFLWANLLELIGYRYRKWAK